MEAANALSEVEEVGSSQKSLVHLKAAKRLLQLCRINGGVYIKVGQHLANLDYILPEEYIQTLSELYNQAPQTPYKDVREVIYQELGQYPEDLFDEFDPNCFASASLAQVHVATLNGEKMAIKVQHSGLRETSKGDLLALEQVVKLVDRIFEEFSWGWIVDEIAPNVSNHKLLQTFFFYFTTQHIDIDVLSYNIVYSYSFIPCVPNFFFRFNIKYY